MAGLAGGFGRLEWRGEEGDDANKAGPIWKSVGFCMGGAVLVFLLWAWGDSMWWASGVSRYSENSIHSGHVEDAFIRLQWDVSEENDESPVVPTIGGRSFWYWERRRDAQEETAGTEIEPLFPPIQYFPGDKESVSVLDLPFWLIVGCYLVFWIGGLCYFRRWQRKRLAAKGR